jgi:adenine-specific DNA-methyltransferase
MSHNKLITSASGEPVPSPIEPTVTAWLARLLNVLVAEREEAQGRAGSLGADAAEAEAEAEGWARSFTAAAVQAFWGELAPALPLRSTPDGLTASPLTPAHDFVAIRFGSRAAELPLDRALEVLGSLYTTLLPQVLRAQRGAFYTPVPLAEHVVHCATLAGADWAGARIVDPACGAGALIVAALRRVRAALAGVPAEQVLVHVAAHLHGCDLDPFAAWLAQVAVDACLADVAAEADRPVPEVVSARDALTIEDASCDVILGNPPYGYVPLTAELRARFGRGVRGRANLYGVFMDLAVQCIRPGGLVALITPTSFLAGQYFAGLREVLAAEAPPLLLGFVSARAGVYDGAVQETVVGLYRRGATVAPAEVQALDLREGRVVVHDLGAYLLPADPGRPWCVPRRPEDAAVAHLAPRLTHRLADWGYAVRTGPADGVKHRDRMTRVPGGATTVPLLWADALSGGRGLAWPVTRTRRPTWFDPAGLPGAMLQRVPCLLLQRTTAPEQARRLVGVVLPFAFLKRQGGAVAVENHINIVEVARDLSGEPVVPLGTMAAFLTSAAADRLFRCMDGSVAVSAYELSHLPLPAPEALATLTRFVERDAPAEEVEAECERVCALVEEADVSVRATDDGSRVHLANGPDRASLLGPASGAALRAEAAATEHKVGQRAPERHVERRGVAGDCTRCPDPDLAPAGSRTMMLRVV